MFRFFRGRKNECSMDVGGGACCMYVCIWMVFGKLEWSHEYGFSLFFFSSFWNFDENLFMLFSFGVEESLYI